MAFQGSYQIQGRKGPARRRDQDDSLPHDASGRRRKGARRNYNFTKENTHNFIGEIALELNFQKGARPNGKEEPTRKKRPTHDRRSRSEAYRAGYTSLREQHDPQPVRRSGRRRGHAQPARSVQVLPAGQPEGRS